MQVLEAPIGVDGVTSEAGIARDDWRLFTDVPAGPHTVPLGSGHRENHAGV